MTMWGKIKPVVSRFLESRRNFYWILAFLVVILVIIPVIIPIIYQFFPSLLTIITWVTINVYFRITFFIGTLQSIVAAVLFAWAAYLWRVEIRQILELRKIYIRAPIQLGVAPLIVARSREIGIWERYGLNIDLDFRYSGKDAINDLYEQVNPPDLAVASDVALCLFLGKKEDPNKELHVLPFVQIKDHLKIIVRKVSTENSKEQKYSTIGDLKGRKIGYYPGTVHEDFLKDIQIFQEENMQSMKSVLDCYRALISKVVDAVVLWEPHWFAFTEFGDVEIIDKTEGDPYEWYLCLVAMQKYTQRNEQTAQKILRSMKDAANYCQLEENKKRVIRDCASFLNTEFTGINDKGLEILLEKRQHKFAVEDSIPSFSKKLNKLIGKGGIIGKGASGLTHSLWEGL